VRSFATWYFVLAPISPGQRPGLKAPLLKLRFVQEKLVSDDKDAHYLKKTGPQRLNMTTERLSQGTKNALSNII
jgi:hypothetical protein